MHEDCNVAGDLLKAGSVEHDGPFGDRMIFRDEFRNLQVFVAAERAEEQRMVAGTENPQCTELGVFDQCRHEAYEGGGVEREFRFVEEKPTFGRSCPTCVTTREMAIETVKSFTGIVLEHCPIAAAPLRARLVEGIFRRCAAKSPLERLGYRTGEILAMRQMLRLDDLGKVTEESVFVEMR